MLVIFARYFKYTCQLNYEAMQYALVRLLEWSHTQGSNNLDSEIVENLFFFFLNPIHLNI